MRTEATFAMNILNSSETILSSLALQCSHCSYKTEITITLSKLACQFGSAKTHEILHVDCLLFNLPHAVERGWPRFWEYLLASYNQSVVREGVFSLVFPEL